jgi:hypothetical protein
MSARITLLRGALAQLLDVTRPIARHSAAGDRALRTAESALAATAFAAPGAFPAQVSTSSGAIVTLHGIAHGRLIGSWIDRDGLQLNDWAIDGTLFGPEDPDDFDLVMPEDAPLLAAVPT